MNSKCDKFVNSGCASRTSGAIGTFLMLLFNMEHFLGSIHLCSIIVSCYFLLLGDRARYPFKLRGRPLVTIYINGKEVEASVKQIRAEKKQTKEKQKEEIFVFL